MRFRKTKKSMDGSCESTVANDSSTKSLISQIEDCHKKDCILCSRETTSDGVDLARHLIKSLHDNDWESTRALVADDLVCYFHNLSHEVDYELNLNDLHEEVANIHRALPDFSLHYKSIRKHPTNSGVVIVNQVVASGTHTAAPYAFGPFEPINPTGKKVVNDPEELHILVQDGKICRLDFYPMGEYTGPAGLYTQLGGFPLL
ncbi:expressed unknown protein [Seminavis robusta]|uniref:Uncharacterized protein n=1 Tax=Seminavis robusta TaxID=568900 RepID=A0A9N8HSI3_9STRA|nr:expressed unknown protein [Seminavis robusta]|eukprot:Sro1170_g248770.1 n/a (203) ;mRNA; f:28014-28622